uniref:AA_permease domain-containing protein n=1 Tax=Macrostomum lignano TaxID=282301 RepID=A0A1I8GE27_9PLAT
MSNERLAKFQNSNGGPAVEEKSAPTRIELRKEIGVVQGMAIIIGFVIGSGIFVSPKGILQESGSVGFSFVMWTLAGVYSGFGALCYAELGTTIPRSGGEYIYVLQVFGPLPAFLVLWIAFIVTGCVTMAANSLLFAKYCLTPLYPGCPVPEYLTRLTAFLSVSLLTAVNCLKVKWATKLAVVMSLSKVCALLVVTGVGMYWLGRGSTENFENSFEGSDYTAGFVSAFYQGFWAYSGWNCLNFLTEEMKRPSRSLPLAITLSLSLITAIYITVNVAYLAVLSPERLVASHAVAVTFAERSMGAFALAMPLLVAMSIFGSLNGEILGMSRVAFTAANEGHFPSVLGMVQASRLTPVPAVLA